MIFIPLMLLALAGGVYLLIEVESKGLGRLYKSLAWLVIFLSLLFLSVGVVRGVIHHRDMRGIHQGHRQFFRGPGRGGFGGLHMFNWKDKQIGAPDSTGN